MKFNLITSYYKDKVAERQQEIDDCLLFNIKNEEIDRIILIVSFKDEKQLYNLTKSKKIKKIVTEKRPTYNDFFALTQNYPEDINAISNSDIIFNQPSVNQLKEYAWSKKYCFALSRWDLVRDENGEVLFTKAVHFNRSDSNDCWLFKGAVPKIEGADFTLGIAGCDNRINYLLLQSGYLTYNPSKNVVTFHYHLSGVRNYVVDIDKTRIPPPYHLIPTCFIEEVPQ